ncbi:recombinase family protein [Micromonospora sp. NPDC048930]|uniref:recombinase family protein n=1 Tax=Micromonospora sp. NPDC048930 TaxID=3364261 RepID=UPI0037234447
MPEKQGLQWLVSPEELERIPLAKRVLGYVRVSDVHGRGDDLISPEIQEHSIKTLTDREGLVIVAWIYDIDKSGRNFTKRRVNETVAGVNAGHWEIVILWKWSRWGRNMKESLIYLSMVEDEARGKVRAATEDFDPKTSIGKFSRNQMLLIAELQSDMIADSWKEAQAKRRRDGLPHTGAPRFGYDYERRTGYTVNQDQAKALKNAYERYVAGESMRALAMEWNAMGLTTVKGNRWSLQSISRMMDTGFAAGLIRERTEPPTSSDTGGSNGRSIWCFDVWREGKHEPIIERETWDAYKKRRDEQATMAPRLRTAVHSLSGLMTCAWEGCGGPMVSVYSGRNKKHSWTCYRARDRKEHPFNSVSNARAEADVLAWLDREAEGGEDIEERRERLRAGREAVADATELEREIRKLKAKVSRYQEMYAEGDLDKADYQRRRDVLKKEIEAAEEKRDSAVSRSEAAGAYAQQKFGVLRDVWHEYTPAERREALLTLVTTIKVMPGPYEPGKKVVPVPKWAKAAA